MFEKVAEGISGVFDLSEDCTLFSDSIELVSVCSKFRQISTTTEEMEHDMKDDGVRLTYKELEAKYKEAQSLLDACYEVVELWDCQAPSQIEWKRGWLEGARRHGATTF